MVQQTLGMSVHHKKAVLTDCVKAFKMSVLDPNPPVPPSTSCACAFTLFPYLQPLLSAVPADIAAQLRPLTPQVVSFFAARGISPAVLVRNRVSTALDRWGRPTVIALPYYVGSTLVNIKYRTLDKRFSQVKGGQQVLYGLNDLQVSVLVWQ